MTAEAAKVTIRSAEAADLQTIRDLFTEYATWLERDHGISLTFQRFEEELNDLPGKYARPAGDMFLAETADGAALGCIAFRPTHLHDTAEVKRLYVRPAGRGLGLGRQLTECMITGARQAGYSRLILDTGPFMTPALALYEKLGFADIPPYYDVPYDDVRFMGRQI